MDMDPVYDRIRHRARQIAAQYPTPDFYTVHASRVEHSTRFLQADPVLQDLADFVSANIENDFGHGMIHAVKVTVDAGALLIIEGIQAGYTERSIRKRLRMIQSAGLLHDIKRKQKNHALQGARYARGILDRFSFHPEEIEDICDAIRNHEAFRKQADSATPTGDLMSGCLYDADKFRWGPDNFTDTIWSMIGFSNISLSEFVGRYPRGMESLDRIKTTFRTLTGSRFGPQFIDFGIEIGERLLQVITTEFSEHL